AAGGAASARTDPVSRATDPLACPALTPEPPSFAVQLALALLARTTAGAHERLTGGGRLSTLLPITGPAVAELPTASPTVFEPVEALLVTVPAATLVVREKVSSAAGATPEPPSLALQALETSFAG